MKEEKQNTAKVEEISLKDLILMAQDFFWEVLGNWIYVGILVVLFAALFFYNANKVPVVYPAALTFMVNEDSGGGGASVGALLGQFGLGGGGGGEYNLDKIVELSKSMRIIREALFEKAMVNGTSDYLANHLIRSENIHDKWKKDTTGLNNFLFTHAAYQNFSKLENKALKKVYSLVKGNSKHKIPSLMSSKYEEETGILTLKFSAQTESLSISFLQKLYEKVSAFYIEEAIEKPRTTYQTIKAKEDSLKSLLLSMEYQLAKKIDSNKGLISKSAQLGIDRLRRDVQLLTLAYGKALENAEISDFSLKNAMPFFQIIDEPISPIEPQKESKFKALLFGGILGGILGSLLFICRKVYRDLMK